MDKPRSSGVVPLLVRVTILVVVALGSACAAFMSAVAILYEGDKPTMSVIVVPPIAAIVVGGVVAYLMRRTV